MITTESARKLSDATLAYALMDLNAVIAAQEPGERQFPGTFGKLNTYYDERHAVLGEIARRKRSADPGCCSECGAKKVR